MTPIPTEQERLHEVIAERDRMRRLFNRLDGAIAHHRRDSPFADEVGDALYAAYERVLRDYQRGKG